ncbi:hypothetical protein KFU94_58900 [Chloroflexi bacterium TSY]|nr:hypothetical protein [Chloroflexi bacterium TSY]
MDLLSLCIITMKWESMHHGAFAGQEGYGHFDPLIETLNAPQTFGRPLIEDCQQISDEVVVPMVQDALSCETSTADALAWGERSLKR